MRQAMRFCVVGFVNTVLDLLVLNLLILTTGAGHSGSLFTFFKTVSFFAAMGNSYLMNARWTFAEPGVRTTALQGAQFCLVSILGAVVNIGSASYVASYVHPPVELRAYWPSVAALVGTGFSFVFNFVGYKYLVFAGHNGSRALNNVQSGEADL
jgi:putative flippase GtrA